MNKQEIYQLWFESKGYNQQPHKFGFGVEDMLDFAQFYEKHRLEELKEKLPNAPITAIHIKDVTQLIDKMISDEK